MAKPEERFTGEDLDLIEDALELIPEVATAVHAARLAKRHVAFPIESYDSLRPLFDKEGHARYKDRVFTFDQGRQFFPSEFFPIESTKDLIIRVMIVLQRAAAIHARDAMSQRAADTAPAEDVSILPSPTPIS